MRRITMPPLALALALLGLVGCEDNENCVGAQCADDTGDIVAETATLHLKAPYEWAGDWWVMWDENTDTEEVTKHLATSECEVEVRAPGNGRVGLWGGDRFMCVIQDLTVSAEQAGTIVEVVDQWTGEGMCGLAPEGEDGGWEVSTMIADIGNGDQVLIDVAGYKAVVTEDTFFYEGEYLLEGLIWNSDDHWQVYFHRVLSTGETELTLELE